MNDFMSFRPSFMYGGLTGKSSYNVYEDHYVLLHEFLGSLMYLYFSVAIWIKAMGFQFIVSFLILLYIQ